MKIKIRRAGAFYPKLEVCPHKKSMGEFRYKGIINGEDSYEVQHAWVTHFIQYFLFWWVLSFDISTDPKGMGKAIYKAHKEKAGKPKEFTEIHLS